RLAEAHRLREAGSSFSEIAQALAIGRATVSRALTATSVPDPTTRRPISTEERTCGLRPSTERQRPAPGSLSVPNSAEETAPLTAESHTRATDRRHRVHQTAVFETGDGAPPAGRFYRSLYDTPSLA